MKNKIGSFGRFLLVSCGAIVIDYFIYMALSGIVDLTIAKLISTTISCVYSYFANKYFTFRESSGGNNGQIGWYVLSQCLNIGFNTLATRTMYGLTGNRTIAFVAATILATIVNYFLQKWLVFDRKSISNIYFH